MKTLLKIWYDMGYPYDDGAYTLYSFPVDFDAIPQVGTEIEVEYRDKIINAKVSKVRQKFKMNIDPYEATKPEIIISAIRYKECGITNKKES